MIVTQRLLTISPQSRSGKKLLGVKALIIHWPASAGSSAMAVRDYFETLKNQKKTFASTHYAVGLYGEIVLMVPEQEVCYHVGSTQLDPASGKLYTDTARQVFGDKWAINANVGPNGWCIGIETCHPDSTGYFAPPTWSALVELAADICIRHGLPVERIYRHKDIVGWKDCPKYWCDHPDQLDIFRQEVKQKMLNIVAESR